MKKTHRLIIGVSFLLVFALVFIFQFTDFKLFKDPFLNNSFESIISRYPAAIILFLLVRKTVLFPTKKLTPKTFIMVLPCFLIVINNLPIIALTQGRAYLVKPEFYLLVLALDCLGVAILEEIVFRGILFQLIKEKLGQGAYKIFLAVLIQALIFGLSHFINLISGAGLLNVLMQIGYSFLLGGMFAVALLITENLWVSIILHFIFNFNGLLFPSLGIGSWWNQPTIIITIILAFLTSIYLTLILVKISRTTYKEESLIKDNYFK